MHSGIGVSVLLAFTGTGMPFMIYWLLEELYPFVLGRLVDLRLGKVVFAHASRRIAAKRARNSIDTRMHSGRRFYQHDNTLVEHIP